MSISFLVVSSKMWKEMTRAESLLLTRRTRLLLPVLELKSLLEKGFITMQASLIPRIRRPITARDLSLRISDRARDQSWPEPITHLLLSCPWGFSGESFFLLFLFPFPHLSISLIYQSSWAHIHISSLIFRAPYQYFARSSLSFDILYDLYI